MHEGQGVAWPLPHRQAQMYSVRDRNADRNTPQIDPSHYERDILARRCPRLQFR